MAMSDSVFALGMSPNLDISYIQLKLPPIVSFCESSAEDIFSINF